MNYMSHISSNFYFSRFRHIYNRQFRRRYSHTHNTNNFVFDKNYSICKLYPLCNVCKYFTKYTYHLKECPRTNTSTGFFSFKKNCYHISSVCRNAESTSVKPPST